MKAQTYVRPSSGLPEHVYDVIEKPCTKCQIVHPLEQFAPVANKKLGKVYKSSQCRKCRQKNKREQMRRRAGRLGLSLSANRRRSPAHRWQRVLSNIRVRCKEKNVECDIDRAYLEELLEAQGDVCALTGWPLWKSEGSFEANSLTVDRLDPTRGYVRGNVRLVTFQANAARGPWDDAQLLKFCRAVLRKLDV